jgi:hypothetical protein
MLKTITIAMTGHCYDDHKERLIKMDRELGFGEIICTTVFRGRRNCLTSTGILMVLDLNQNILITAYPARWKIACKMFFEATGSCPPAEYSEVIRRAKAWDYANNWM